MQTINAQPDPQATPKPGKKQSADIRLAKSIITF